MSSRSILFPVFLDRKRGSALVTTLLVLVVLTIIVVAFLQSMTIERQTANSYSKLNRATLAAQTGIADAMNRLEVRGDDTPFHYVIAEAPAKTPEDAHLQLIVLEKDMATSKGDPVELASVPAAAGSEGADAKKETFTLDLTPQAATRDNRRLKWKPLTDGGDREVARYAFWVDAASGKQDAGVHAGQSDPLNKLKDAPSGRDALRALAELPLLTAEGLAFSAADSSKLQAYQFITPKPEDRKDLFTPATINQIVTITPAATGRDFTIASPHRATHS